MRGQKEKTWNHNTVETPVIRVAWSNKILKGSNLVESNFKHSSKIEKGQIFFKYFVLLIFKKQALKCTIFLYIQKVAKWSNHLISSKKFEKAKMATLVSELLRTSKFSRQRKKNWNKVLISPTFCDQLFLWKC